MLRRRLFDLRELRRMTGVPKDLLAGRTLRSAVLTASATNKAGPKKMVSADSDADYFIKAYQEVSKRNAVDSDDRRALNVFSHELKEDRYLSNEEWEQLTGKLLGLPDEKGKLVNNIYMSSFILQTCSQLDYIICARSWSDHAGLLEDNNLARLVPLLNMVRVASIKDQEDFAIKIAQKFLDDSLTQHSHQIYWAAVEVLSKTTLWMKAFQILSDHHLVFEEDHDVSNNFSVRPSAVIAGRALKEDKIDLVFQIMQDPKFHDFNVPLRDRVTSNQRYREELFREIINYSKSLPDRAAGRQLVDRLFTFLRDYDIHISVDFSEFLRDQSFSMRRLMKEGKLMVYKTRIQLQSGKCIKCGNKLSRTPLTKEEFSRLKEGVINAVIIKNDIYQSSNPQELKEFLKMIEKERFDVVIDGLNVSLFRTPSMKNLGKPITRCSKHLLEVVSYFHKQGKRILVIHRAQIKGYPHFPEIESLARVHILEKTTSDDPYMILASLYSECLMLTSDHLRTHYVDLKRIDRSLAQLYMRWQILHQISLTGFDVHDRQYEGKPRMIFPPLHDVRATQSGGYWHIPILRDAEPTHVLHTKMLYSGNSDYWLCIGPEVKQPSGLSIYFDYGNEIGTFYEEISKSDKSEEDKDHFTGNLRDSLGKEQKKSEIKPRPVVPKQDSILRDVLSISTKTTKRGKDKKSKSKISAQTLINNLKKK